MCASYTKDGVKKIGEGTYGEAYKGGGMVGSGLLRLDSRVQSSWFVACNTRRPISVCRLGEMPTQSCEQSVSAPRGKAGARLNAHTDLRAKRQR